MASSFIAYLRLIELGKAELAFAGPLARYAACQYLRGRRVGSRMNACDVTSDYCQRRKKILVEQLDRFDDPTSEWEQLVVEDRHSTPAEVAMTRLDFRGVARVAARADSECCRNPRHRRSHEPRRTDVWLLGVEDQPATPRALSWLACLHRRRSADDIISFGLI